MRTDIPHISRGGVLHDLYLVSKGLALSDGNEKNFQWPMRRKRAARGPEITWGTERRIWTKMA